MRKKLLALGLVFILVISSLAGCKNKDSDSKSTSSNTSSESSGEKVKLKALFVSHPLTQSVEDMEWLTELEEKCGVEIEWEQIYSDWDQTKATRFAAGDIPDLVFNATTDSDYITYNGLFQDLTDLIAKDAPNITKMFEEEPDTKTLAQTYEGKIFGVPKFQGKWPESNTVMFINQTWLDNLGLKAPTTLSELKNVLIAFRDQDANGNGDPNDEIPLDFNGWFSGAYSLTNLIGSLGIQLTNWGVDGYFAEDGVVKNYAVDERYKLLVKYLADLYSEGLINENAITNDYSAFQSLSRGDENGNALVGVDFGWEETDKFGPTLYSQYKPLGALAYDINTAAGTYDTRWTYDYTGLNMSTNRVAMSAKCKNKDAAMKFIDAFYDETTSVEVLFGGITDGCIQKVSDSKFKVLDPLDKDTDAGTWKWTSTFADNGPMYIRKSTEIEMAQDMSNALSEREAYKDVLAKISESDNYPQMFMKYTEADQNAMAVAQANINNITNNYWALWLTGESDIDADWDAYVASVESAGLNDVLKIRQAAFDAYLAK
jgi:putative aldouronate transport system substrate-binding protein